MTRDELIGVMNQAYLDEAEKAGFCVEQHDHIRKQRIKGMSAALDVAIEKCRTVVLEQRCERGTPWDLAIMACVREIDLLKPKNVEERVTVDEVHTTPLNYSPNCAFTCHLDGKPAGPLHSNREYAEIYRLGLIAQLKEPK